MNIINLAGGFRWVIRTFFYQRQTSYYCEGSRWRNKNNQSKTISNLHIFPCVILLFKLYSLAIFTFLVMITSHISHLHISLSCPHTKLKAKLIFLDESTNSVLCSLFLCLLCCFPAGPALLQGDVATFSPQFFIMEDCPAQPDSVPISLSFLSPTAIYRLFTRAVRSLRSNLTMQIVSKYKPTLCEIFLILSSKLFLNLTSVDWRSSLSSSFHLEKKLCVDNQIARIIRLEIIK